MEEQYPDYGDDRQLQEQSEKEMLLMAEDFICRCKICLQRRDLKEEGLS